MKTIIIVALTTLFTWTSAAAEPQPSPEDFAKMLAAFKEMAAPVAQHDEFQRSVGEWNVVERHFMGPKPVEARGTASIRTMLGGRYLVQEYRSKGPFGDYEGFGITGYDKAAKKYVLAWTDTMSTGIMLTRGVKKGKTTTYQTREKDPKSGKSVTARMELREVGKDKTIFVMSHKPDGAKQFTKQMEITYTRVK